MYLDYGKSIILFVGFATFLSACSDSKRPTPNNNAACPGSRQPFLLVGSDSAYENSAVLCLRPKADGSLKDVAIDSVYASPGGDSYLTKTSTSDHKWMFIERSSKSQYATSLTLDDRLDQGLSIIDIKTQASPFSAVGDPIQILSLNDYSVLAASYSQNEITQLSLEPGGELRQTHSLTAAQLNLAPTLKPVHMVQFEEFVFVLHQGLTFANRKVSTNHASHLLVFQIAETSDVSPLGYNEIEGTYHFSANSGQSKPMHLQGSVANQIVLKDSKLYVYSLCSNFVDNKNTCRNLIEVFTVEKKSPNKVSLSPLRTIPLPNDFAMNGAQVGIYGTRLFANLVSSQGETQVIGSIAVDASEKNWQTEHTYSPNANGFHLLEVIDKENSLYFVESNASTGRAKLCRLVLRSNEVSRLDSCTKSSYFIPNRLIEMNH